MSKRFKFLLASVLLPLLIASYTAALPAAAATQGWSVIPGPGDSGNVVVNPSEVTAIATGPDGAVYALDGAYLKLYRSVNYGLSWDDITANLTSAGAALPVGELAASADQPGLLAVITNGGTRLFISRDGGFNWTDYTPPGNIGGTIQSLAISNQYQSGGVSIAAIAIGTASFGDASTTGQAWLLELNVPLTSWHNLQLRVDPSFPGGEVSAIAFSPNFGDDGGVIVVASTAGDVTPAFQNGTFVCKLGKSGSWNSITGYPVAVGSLGGDVPGARLSSSLALPSDFVLTQPQLFVSVDRYVGLLPDGGNDVYLVDTASHRLNAGNGSSIDIANVAYNGSSTAGILLAGEVAPVPGTLTVQVLQAINPFTAVLWQTASAPPTGPGNARLAWSPDGQIAYCGTGQLPGVAGDESAVSGSLDGDAWVQMGLVNTVIHLDEIAPTPDSSGLYAITTDPIGSASVWRSAGSPLGNYWQRILTLDTTNSVIIRLSPNFLNDDTLYIAELGSTVMAVSHDGGDTWQWRTAPGPVVDLLAVGDTIYVALPDGYISFATDSGITWRGLVKTPVDSINRLAFAGLTLLVAGKDGQAAFSTDGGASFIGLPDLPAGGDVILTASGLFPGDPLLFATSSAGGVYRYDYSLGASAAWDRIDNVLGAPVSSSTTTTEYAADTFTITVPATNTGSIIIQQYGLVPQAGQSVVVTSNDPTNLPLVFNGTTGTWTATPQASFTTGTATLSVTAVGTIPPVQGNVTNNGTGVTVTVVGTRGNDPLSVFPAPSIASGVSSGFSLQNVSGSNSTSVIDLFSPGTGIVCTTGAAGMVYAVDSNAVTRIKSGESDVNQVYSEPLVAPPSISFFNIWYSTPTGTTNTQIWTIGTDTKGVRGIYTYTDTLAVLGSGAAVSQIGTNSAIITWNIGTDSPFADATAYKVVITSFSPASIKNFARSGTDAGITVTVDNTAGSARVTGLTPGTTYYFNIWAAGPVSSFFTNGITTFSTLPMSPGYTSHLSPPDGATDVLIAPDFAWDAVAGATSYDFQLTADANFVDASKNVVTTSITGGATYYAPSAALDNSTTYYWRVRAVTPTGTSAYVTSVFTTVARGQPPVTVTQSQPVIITISPQQTPTYIWLIVALGAILTIAVIVLIVRTG